MIDDVVVDVYNGRLTDASASLAHVIISATSGGGLGARDANVR